MCLRRLLGRMSVQTASMYSRHACLSPAFPTAVQPLGTGLKSGPNGVHALLIHDHLKHDVIAIEYHG